MRACALALSMCAGMASGAQAATMDLPLSEVLEMPQAQERLDSSVRLFLKGDAAPEVAQRLGVAVAAPSTNAFGKDKAAACRWAALSALRELQGAARQSGANAVIGIRDGLGNDTALKTFRCHVGLTSARVKLFETYANLAP